MSRTAVIDQNTGRILRPWAGAGVGHGRKASDRSSLAIQAVAADALARRPAACEDVGVALLQVERDIASARAGKYGWSDRDARKLSTARAGLAAGLNACARGGTLSGPRRKKDVRTGSVKATDGAEIKALVARFAAGLEAVIQKKIAAQHRGR